MLQCSTKARQPRPHYGAEEVDFIMENLGSIPISVLITQFQSNKNFPQRTTKALRKKLCELKEQHNITEIIEDYLSVKQVAEALGIKWGNVNHWLSCHKLPFRRVSKVKRHIKKEALKQFALAKPHLFRSLDPHALFWLLENKRQVRQIRSLPPHSSARCGKRRTVRRVSDGAIFPSIRKAAECSFLCPSTISQAISRGKSYGGSFWEVI